MEHKHPMHARHRVFCAMGAGLLRPTRQLQDVPKERDALPVILLQGAGVLLA